MIVWFMMQFNQGWQFVRSGFRSVRSTIFTLFLISFVLVRSVRSEKISFVLRSKFSSFQKWNTIAKSKRNCSLSASSKTRDRFSFAERRTNETERKERNFRSRSVPFFVLKKNFVPFRSKFWTKKNDFGTNERMERIANPVRNR